MSFMIDHPLIERVSLLDSIDRNGLLTTSLLVHVKESAGPFSVKDGTTVAEAVSEFLRAHGEFANAILTTDL